MAFGCMCPPTALRAHSLHIACVASLTCLAFINVTAQNVVPATKPAPWAAKSTLYYTSLSKTVQAEKVRPGDPVEFKLLEATLVNGHVVPANATMHGKVVEARVADAKDNQDSRLAVLVDSITWKHNSMAMCGSIVGFGAREYKFSGPPVSDRDGTSTWRINPSRQDGMGRSAFSDSSPGVFGAAAGMRDPFGISETNVVVTGAQFVKDLEIYWSPSSASVISRRDKNVKLPGGLLVAIEELPNGGTACSAPVAQ